MIQWAEKMASFRQKQKFKVEQYSRMAISCVDHAPASGALSSHHIRRIEP